MMPVPLKYFGIALTIAFLTELAVGQHYHFSNGWKSGRKRSGLGNNLCEMRPELINYINTLITEELNRISTQCVSVDDKDSEADYSETALTRLQNGLKIAAADRKWKK